MLYVKRIIFLIIVMVILTGCGNNKLVEKYSPSISVDYSGAEAMLKILENTKEGKLARKQLEKVLDTEGYRHYLSHLNRFPNRHLSKDDFIDIVNSLSCQLDKPWNNQLKNTFYKNLKNSIQSIDRAQKLLDSLKGEKFDEYLLSEVMAKLPKGTRINTTIYFIAGGYSPAYAKDGCIGVDILQIKSRLTLEQALKHELHHLGFQYWHDLSQATGANKLIADLFSEGTATYFFTRNSLFGRKATIDMYRTLEEDLNRIMHGNPDSHELEKIYSDYIQGFPGKAYIIGTDMCSTIVKAFGEEKLVELIKRPVTDFFKTYNEAAGKIVKESGLQKYIFSAKTIGELE